MGYCTLSDIRKVMPEQDIIELTDDSTPPSVIDSGNVERAIGDAGELIDGYLRSRYQLPFTPAPAFLNTLAADIAVYRLYARRIRLTPPEGVTERYRGALKLLERIQKGLMSLGGEAPSPQASGPEFTGPERVFTKESLEDY
ncbi:MAG: DUF1320 domain-containing protein [Deltaproteobacteria bacterium]|nr:DUF1320 domain-containing protein [Deltaproteobacteria bacterium]